jgi:hypothetical protein
MCSMINSFMLYTRKTQQDLFVFIRFILRSKSERFVNVCWHWSINMSNKIRSFFDRFSMADEIMLTSSFTIIMNLTCREFLTINYDLHWRSYSIILICASKNVMIHIFYACRRTERQSSWHIMALISQKKSL